MIYIEVIWIFILTGFYGQIFIYETENDENIEKYDCVYYVPENGEEIPYCRRSGESITLQRSQNKCDNEGERISFHSLLDKDLIPKYILEWNSSIDIVDVYASIFYDRSSLINHNYDLFLCKCTKPGTFGRYCEYQLTHEKQTFKETIEAQFKQKETGDSWDTQRYGQILCYKTLPCFSSPLCLDWHEINDGVQKCENGIDEENWDRLEFNECDENEFRCTNGMCIAEEFWLDGYYDCMDWSDEYYTNDGEPCPWTSNSLLCDEHICMKQMYSCGDGECVEWYIRMAFQRVGKASDDCFNKRNLNYMCEVGHHRTAWTLENGLCWPDRGYDDLRYPSLDLIFATNLTDDEICQYLLRCILSADFEYDCPCNNQICPDLMQIFCSLHTSQVLYPPAGLINSNVFTYYDYELVNQTSNIAYFKLHGSIRCQGYFYTTYEFIPCRITYYMFTVPSYNYYLCTNEFQTFGYVDHSSHLRMNLFCWNKTLTFNGRLYAVHPDICSSTRECISQYHIRDGVPDCLFQTDESGPIERSYCTGNVGRQRFQCFDNEKKCLSLIMFGSIPGECSNQYDESWYGAGTVASFRQEVPCFPTDTTGCQRVKQYIVQSSNKNSTSNHSQHIIHRQTSIKYMPFRSYCDTIWDLDEHIDEIVSSCKHWTCHENEYQCRTGQCIPVEWVCDGVWDCADASDEEATVLSIKNMSNHNARLIDLPSQLSKCQSLYSEAPFSKICNQSFEFGCYRSNVSNPLNITLNRPCINLTQIGDHIEDCYNAYDERNTFTADSSVSDMWGFHFRCQNGHHEVYRQACDMTETCTNILCPNYRAKQGTCSQMTDFICPEDDHCQSNIRCNGIPQCDNGEDEYWCPSGPIVGQNIYRLDKIQLMHQRQRQYSIAPRQHPFHDRSENNQQETVNSTDDLRIKQLFKSHSYQCNRGIAVIQRNETQCLCPPAYYGRWCQFYNDRISIIAHVHSLSSNVTLKIRAQLVFEERTIIDYHEFHILPAFERIKTIKHRFYLIYSRSHFMLAHKQDRYFNRTDIINNHPYSVYFDAFALETNLSIHEIGSWHYPINFDYLPAFRLAIVLKLPFWFRNETTFNSSCIQKNCNENSTCLPIFNQNNSSYCSCKNGYYGTNCSLYESACEKYCSKNSICRINKNNKLHCICPLGFFGRRCHLKYEGCDSNPCLNNGTCRSYYDRTGRKPYECQCLWGFDGNRCQYQNISVRVHLNTTWKPLMSALVVQLYDWDRTCSILSIRHQQIFHTLPSIITYDDPNLNAPMLGVLKIYENYLSQPHYFILYVLRRSVINVTSFPEYCPSALKLLSESKKKVDFNRTIPDIFHYHYLCMNQTNHLCFYDDYYLCLCAENYDRADCLIYNPQIDHCDRCFSMGKCLRDSPKIVNKFLCICPSCHYGYRCEFNLQAFGFTLDSLLVDCSKTIKIVYTSIAFLLSMIGFITNLCSWLTFIRPTPRKLGPGNYLLVLTCCNQAALFCLLLKFSQITFGLANVYSCKIISYLLSVFTRSAYWLTSWVTVERLLIIIFPLSPTLKTPRIAIYLCIITSVGLFAIHIHELIHYTSIQHIPTSLSICVTNYDSILISTYDRVTTLIHYLVPFIIQIIGITILIVLVSFSRKKTTKAKKTFSQVLTKQFQTQKELYITPIIIILSALPETIIAFSLVCTQLTNWQRHMLLDAYLLSYAPQVLGFVLYVLPSTTYKKEFKKTSIAQKYFARFLT